VTLGCGEYWPKLYCMCQLSGGSQGNTICHITKLWTLKFHRLRLNMPTKSISFKRSRADKDKILNSYIIFYCDFDLMKIKLALCTSCHYRLAISTHQFKRCRANVILLIDDLLNNIRILKKVSYIYIKEIPE
jgi:hypothetical protein